MGAGLRHPVHQGRRGPCAERGERQLLPVFFLKLHTGFASHTQLARDLPVYFCYSVLGSFHGLDCIPGVTPQHTVANVQPPQ